MVRSCIEFVQGEFCNVELFLDLLCHFAWFVTFCAICRLCSFSCHFACLFFVVFLTFSLAFGLLALLHVSWI
jgi:hypothetical protein